MGMGTEPGVMEVVHTASIELNCELVSELSPPPAFSPAAPLSMLAPQEKELLLA